MSSFFREIESPRDADMALPELFNYKKDPGGQQLSDQPVIYSSS